MVPWSQVLASPDLHQALTNGQSRAPSGTMVQQMLHIQGGRHKRETWGWLLDGWCLHGCMLEVVGCKTPDVQQGACKQKQGSLRFAQPDSTPSLQHWKGI
ncbi:hypothetical protein V6N11_034301 [Hibiscus sabdariffa]|uniref:Uncharacterized protein n=1 Tax=Hibiscus sabdariffa TaxID=183260 RepID=A0ABR1ZFJ7_9ROSI